MKRQFGLLSVIRNVGEGSIGDESEGLWTSPTMAAAKMRRRDRLSRLWTS